MSEEREVEIVVGTVDSIIQKGENKWQAVVKTVDSAQYGKKLWTKSPDQHRLITSLLGQVATFECGVSHWTNSDGKPVTSLWINAVNPGAPPPQAAQEATGSPQTPAQPQQAPAPAPKRTDDPTRVSIERQTALKAAVELYARKPDAHADLTLATAQRFAAFLATGVAFVPVDEDPQALPEDPDIPF